MRKILASFSIFLATILSFIENVHSSQVFKSMNKDLMKVRLITVKDSDYKKYLEKILTDSNENEIINKIGLELTQEKPNLGDMVGRVVQCTIAGTSDITVMQENSKEVIFLVTYVDIVVDSGSEKKKITGRFSLIKDTSSSTIEIRNNFLTDDTPISTQLYTDVLTNIIALSGASEIQTWKVFIQNVSDTDGIKTQKWHIASKGKVQKFDVILTPDGKGGSHFTIKQS